MPDFELIVRQIIHEELDIPMKEINPSSHFVNDLGADSFDTINILSGIQSKFRITLSQEEASELSTVSQLVEKVEQKYHSPSK